MHLEIFLLFITTQHIYGQLCEVCQNLIVEFNVGLQKSEKSNFGGGNTAWEEKRLGNYATSETRFVHIVENLCPSSVKNIEKCQYLREEVEETMEQWWFQVFKKNQSATDKLFQYLCVDSLKVCCPDNHFGSSCEKCLHYNESSGSICSNHGKCDGNGTRTGNGSCICFDGYTNDSCSQCAFNYYLFNNEDLSCNRCHESCQGCTGYGPDKCEACSSGWKLDNETGGTCSDINECEDENEIDICSSNQYCSNNPGSYSCEECDKSCLNCTGPGSDHCTACNAGYQLVNNVCEDVNECDDPNTTLCKGDGQVCKNVLGSYHCECLENYTLQSDGACILNESQPPNNDEL